MIEHYCQDPNVTPKALALKPERLNWHDKFQYLVDFMSVKPLSV